MAPVFSGPDPARRGATPGRQPSRAGRGAGWLLAGALAAGCAHHRPPDAEAPGEPSPCVVTSDRGAERYNVGKVDDAVRIWAEGYATCGPGFGFLAHQAVAAAKVDRYDDAARLAIRELSEPGPTPLALKLLIALKGKVSAEMTSTVYGLGRTPEAAVVIPDIQGEYAWIRFLVCGGKEEALRQSLTSGPRGALDRMEFVCPGATTPQTLYFDYSSDPAERAMIRAMSGDPVPAAGAGTAGGP